MLQRKDRQLEEQAATLRILRERLRRRGKLTGKVRKQRLEIFRLRNELDAMNGLVENAADVPSAARASEKPGVGAPPDFVIIGTKKGGTSLLYRLLTEHPLFEPAATKELHFFDNRFSEGLSWYGQHFPTRKCVDGRQTVSGEATPSYLLNPLVSERMAKTIPDAKLIALLRNPVDRAYSHYQMGLRRGDEVRPFEEAGGRRAGDSGRDVDRVPRSRALRRAARALRLLH